MKSTVIRRWVDYMPRGQPFTKLCQRAAALGQSRSADLHVHTTASDGDYTPSQVVMLAARAGLTALAITDHDTLAGLEEAVVASRQLTRQRPEVIPGVEMTTSFAGRSLHVLAYFVDPSHADLCATLTAVCDQRRHRFRAYLTQFAASGVMLPVGAAARVESQAPSLGRRHLAGLLMDAGVVRSRYAAFQRYILPATEHVPQSHAISAEWAIPLIRNAGGVSSLAHPPTDLGDTEWDALRDIGLRAIEAVFPTATASRSEDLRATARRLGLAVTGGSDCHGPEPAGRVVGAKGVTRDELAALRALAS